MSNTASLKDRENSLFDEWKKKLVMDKPFVRDGLMDEDKYLASQKRVVFILKEAWGGNEFDLREGALKYSFSGWGRSRQTWRTVIAWAYGLLRFDEISSDEIKEYLTDKDRWNKTLRTIGVINFNKTPSATGVSSDKKLWEVALRGEENAKFLKRQWDIYNADIAVCGSDISFCAMQQALGVPEEEIRSTRRRGTRYWRQPSGQVFIEACHPATRCPEELKWFMVFDAMQDIQTDKK